MRDERGLAPSAVVREDLARLHASLAPRCASLAGATVVVAGGAGFLGIWFVDTLLALNDGGLDPQLRVIVLDNFASGVPARLAHLKARADVTLERVDIARPLSLTVRADCIVHSASIASPPRYRQFPIETIEANVWGTRHLLDYAATSGTRTFLYLSSSEVYGDPDPSAIPTPETYRGYVSATGPRACYDESKRLGETLCVAYYQQRGVPVKIVRPFNVYGPRLSLDDGRIVPDLIADAVSGRPLRLYSDGRATRSFCYVTDAVDGMLTAMLSAHDGEAFNIGNAEEITIDSLARIVAAAAPSRPPVVHERHADPQYTTDNPTRRCPDLSKSAALLDYVPRVSTAVGVGRTLHHYLSAGVV